LDEFTQPHPGTKLMDPNWVLISNESFLSSFQINAQF
jgi:hypothetical protein